VPTRLQIDARKGWLFPNHRGQFSRPSGGLHCAFTPVLAKYASHLSLVDKQKALTAQWGSR